MTLFSKVYDQFFSKITDDMYLEISPEQTREDCRMLLTTSITLFEFPKVALKYQMQDEFGEEAFVQDLSNEEINILAEGMVIEWCNRQIMSVDALKQKVSGSDFKVSSQASHLQRLNNLIASARAEHRRLQLLYSRREEGEDGKPRTTMGKLVKPIRQQRRRRRY